MWGQLARSLLEIEFGRSLVALADAQIIDRRFLPFDAGQEMAESVNMLCVLHANQILENILIPHLAENP